MKNPIAKPILEEFSRFLSKSFGLYFDHENSMSLSLGVQKLLALWDLQDPWVCLDKLKNQTLTQYEIETVVGLFTIGETYFFREPKTFLALKDHVFPDIIQVRKNLQSPFIRIWCAGCSTGEEPYTVAILLNELLPNIQKWNITILATDVNTKALEILKNGVYREWSFRTIEPYYKEKYFKEIEPNLFEINLSIKNIVLAEHLNMAVDNYPSLINNTSAMDVILCRNMLMYFSNSQAKSVIKHLNESLVDNGILILGASENSIIQEDLFKSENISGALIHRKRPLDELVSSPEVLREEMLSDEAAPISSLSSAPSFSPLPSSEFNPKSKGLHNAKLSKQFANQGHLERGLLKIDKAITEENLNPQFYYLKALILQELGRLEEAAAVFNKTIYLDSNFILAYFGLANITRLQGKQHESERYFKIVLSLLKQCHPKEILPAGEGMTALRLSEIVRGIGIIPDEELLLWEKEEEGQRGVNEL